jgi:hypothetical protein
MKTPMEDASDERVTPLLVTAMAANKRRWWHEAASSTGKATWSH